MALVLPVMFPMRMPAVVRPNASVLVNVVGSRNVELLLAAWVAVSELIVVVPVMVPVFSQHWTSMPPDFWWMRVMPGNQAHQLSKYPQEVFLPVVF
jgi:hypothetical protein